MTYVKISITTSQSVVTPPQVQLYFHREDKDTDIFDGGVRDCAVGGCPAVFVLNEPRLKVQMDMHWQFYLRAINYKMSLENVFLILDDALAFANNSGFDNLDNPGKKDFFFGRTNYPEYPRLEKDRTCSRNVLTGVEEGSLLKVVTFDGNKPPPMKPGKIRPQRLQDVRLEDYLYNPREHPWMFCVANRITTKPGNQTSIAPFPRGAIYEWTGDNLPYTWIPHVSTETIYYPLRYFIKIPLGNPKPSPYRIVTT